MHRRTFLAAIPAASTLAGCTETGTTGDDDVPTSSSPAPVTASPTATRSPTPEPTTAEPTTAQPTTGKETFAVPDHPATADLAAQPARGPGPRSAPGLVVTFSDPSCPYCARFADRTVSQIVTNLVEPGKATYVHRTIPIIHDWAKPCVQAQEATFARDAEAFWALTKFYYGQQRAFYEGADVFSKTRTFLAENTDVDADAVISDAEAKTYDDAIQTDLEASRNADVSGTPTSFLFKEGEYVTTLKGSKSYTVVEAALNL